METYIRRAIRDAVYQGSRKPFTWGGLSGYEQLQAIAQGLDQVQEIHPHNAYLHVLQSQVNRVLVKNQTVAEDLKKAHQILYQVARCLHYPPGSPSQPQAPIAEPLTSLQVAQEIDTLLQEIHLRPGIGPIARVDVW